MKELIIFFILGIHVFAEECNEKKPIRLVKGLKMKCVKGQWLPVQRRGGPSGPPCEDDASLSAQGTCSADRGHCSQFTQKGAQMDKDCPGTCDSCDSCRCQDNFQWHKYCPFWAQYCDSPGLLGNWMSQNCRKSCNKCKCKCCSYQGKMHGLNERIPLPEKCGELVCEEGLVAEESPLLAGAAHHNVSHPEELTLVFWSLFPGSECCLLPVDEQDRNNREKMVQEGWSGQLSRSGNMLQATCCHGILCVPLKEINSEQSPASTSTETTTTATTTTTSSTTTTTATTTTATTTSTMSTTTTTATTTTATTTSTTSATTTTATTPTTTITTEAPTWKEGQCVVQPESGWDRSDAVNPGPRNNVNFCIAHCKAQGFIYAGPQYRWCFCGNPTPPESSFVPEDECDIICPGNAGQTCGGGFKLNVYTTGIGCQVGWERYGFSCFRVFSKQVTWKQAQAACQTENGYLASILDSTTNKGVSNLIQTISSAVPNYDRMWIGLSRQTRGSAWKWVDKSPLKYEFWSKGSPSGDGDCAEIVSERIGGKAWFGWNDLSCNSIRSYICEKHWTAA